jgi:hypothetical protein
VCENVHCEKYVGRKGKGDRADALRGMLFLD